MKKHGRELRLAVCLLALAMCATLLCSCTGKADSYTAAMPVIVVGSDNYPPCWIPPWTKTPPFLP